MTPDPVLRFAREFVAPPRDQVYELVCAVYRVDATSVGRVRVEDLGGVVPGEDADAFSVLEPRLRGAVVVDRGAVGEPFGSERDSKVVVELRTVRGDPRERPAHAPLIGGNLSERRAGDRDERHVTSAEMHGGAVEVVRPERAARPRSGHSEQMPWQTGSNAGSGRREGSR